MQELFLCLLLPRSQCHRPPDWSTCGGYKTEGFYRTANRQWLRLPYLQRVVSLKIKQTNKHNNIHSFKSIQGQTLNQSIKALTKVHVSYIVYQTNHFGTSSIKSKQISYIYFWNKPFLWTELHIKWKLFIRMLIKQLMLIF